MHFLVLIPCLLLCSFLVDAELTINYDKNTSLSSEASLSWNFDNATKMFSFGLEVATANVSTSDAVWVGIGVGEPSSGGMLGADIFTAQFPNNVLDNCTTTNRHVPFVAFPIGAGNDTVFPVPDQCQGDKSWKLVSCSRDPQKKTLALEVSRPMDAVTDQDRAIVSGENPMMYAYGVAGSVAYHRANRFTKRVALVNSDGTYPESADRALPDDISSSFTFTNDKYLVPNVTTTYACTSKKMTIPKDEKVYFVAAENIVEEKAHHFIMYACEDNEYTRNFTETKQCYTEDRGGANDPRAKCNMLHVWAHGRGSLILPKDVGMTLDEKTSMFILEVHYDNPNLSNTTRDSSGVKLHFSKKRTIEAGILQLGDAPVTLGGEVVKNDFNYTSTCPSWCTNTWEADQINVFSGFSHMHTTGKLFWSNRYDSNGNFVKRLTNVAFWSNDHQAGIDYSPPMVIKKGDTLSTTCNFDTSKLPKTIFGIETKDEMCIDFMWYYPVQRRSPEDSNNFVCGFASIPMNGTRKTATICGDPTKRDRNVNLNATNPSFDDTQGFSDSFGNRASTCSAVLSSDPGNSTNTTTPSDGAVCFPGSARVNTRQRGVVTMSELRVNDEVEVGGGAYSPVFMFTHRDSKKSYEFVQLETENGEQLRLTAGHFVYADGLLKRADEVNVGEYLLNAKNTRMRVVNVNRVVDVGIFNPQTLHGDIVVEGVVTSTYTHAIEKLAAHAMLAPVRALYEWFDTSCAALEKDHYFVVRLFRFVRQLSR